MLFFFTFYEKESSAFYLFFNTLIISGDNFLLKIGPIFSKFLGNF